MQIGCGRHNAERELVTIPAAQLRLTGIERVTDDDECLVDQVMITGTGDVLQYSQRLLRGSALSSFVEF